MAQQLISAGNAVRPGFTPADFTPVGSTPAGFTPVGSTPAGFTPAGFTPAGASQSDCCTHYTVAEGHCQAGGCGSGSCCYHVVSTGCSIDKYLCVDLPCSTGDFSTGC
jgi:hypothetical protein